MAFQAVAIDTLPKRASRIKEVDIEAANALLAIVNQPGQAASDGEAFDTQADARGAAGKARRMLVRVAGDKADLVKSRVYADGDKWRWSVYFGDEPKKAKGKKAA